MNLDNILGNTTPSQYFHCRTPDNSLTFIERQERSDLRSQNE